MFSSDLLEEVFVWLLMADMLVVALCMSIIMDFLCEQKIARWHGADIRPPHILYKLYIEAHRARGTSPSAFVERLFWPAYLAVPVLAVLMAVMFSN